MQIIREISDIEEDLAQVSKLAQDYKDALQDQNIEDLIEAREKCGSQLQKCELNYFKEFWKYYILNEICIGKINEINEMNQQLEDCLNQFEVAYIKKYFQSLQSELKVAFQCKLRKKNRRCSNDIEKMYTCPYDNCKKQYGSDVALNLHVKLKHNGGSKTERERIAKELIKAELSGQTHHPPPGLKFPPGYLEKLKNDILLG